MNTQDEALMKELVPEVVPAENIAVFKKTLMETLSRVDILLDSMKRQCAVPPIVQSHRIPPLPLEAIPPLPHKWARDIRKIISFVNNTEVSRIPYLSLNTYLDDIADEDKNEYCKCIMNHLGGSEEKETFMIDYFNSKGVNLKS